MPEVMGKPWYVEAFLPERKTDPSATPARDEPLLAVSLSMLEEVACEILDLYSTPAAKGALLLLHLGFRVLGFQDLMVGCEILDLYYMPAAKGARCWRPGTRAQAGEECSRAVQLIKHAGAAC